MATAGASSCAGMSSTCQFTVQNVAYMKYLTLPGGFIDQTPDSITMAFDVTNTANGVNTACSFTNGKFMGEWADKGTRWYPCGDRTISSSQGTKSVVKTNARFNWDSWQLSVNQTWTCADGEQ